jgi:hypothetical protein
MSRKKSIRYKELSQEVLDLLAYFFLLNENYTSFEIRISSSVEDVYNGFCYGSDGFIYHVGVVSYLKKLNNKEWAIIFETDKLGDPTSGLKICSECLQST